MTELNRATLNDVVAELKAMKVLLQLLVQQQGPEVNAKAVDPQPTLPNPGKRNVITAPPRASERLPKE